MKVHCQKCQNCVLSCRHSSHRHSLTVLMPCGRQAPQPCPSASQPSTWTRVSQKPLRAVLQLRLLRVALEHFLSDANEAVALLLDNDISGKHCDVEEVQPGKLKWHASPEANLVSQWLQAIAGERHSITQKLVAMGCGLLETLQPGGSMQSGTRSHAGQNLRGCLDQLQVWRI
jgi:hypothetical protein